MECLLPTLFLEVIEPPPPPVSLSDSSERHGAAGRTLLNSLAAVVAGAAGGLDEGNRGPDLFAVGGGVLSLPVLWSGGLSTGGKPAKYFGGACLRFPSCSDTRGVMMAESGGGIIDPVPLTPLEEELAMVERGSFISLKRRCRLASSSA